MRMQLTAALLLLASPSFAAPAPGKDSDCDITVKHGQSIQNAINKAKKGSKIVIEKGDYYEQLTITKDGIQLIGKEGATLYPPKDGYKPNFCTGLSKNFPPPFGDFSDTDAGICIYGNGFELAPFVNEHRMISKEGEYIKNVVITGLTVSNFTGENIALIGGKNTKVHNNKLINGGQYGFLTVGSKNTEGAKNHVTNAGLGFIAMCMDDKSDAVFRDNNVSNCEFTPI